MQFTSVSLDPYYCPREMNLRMQRRVQAKLIILMKIKICKKRILSIDKLMIVKLMLSDSNNLNFK